MPVPVVIAEEGVVSEVPPVTVALPLWDWDCVNVMDLVMPEAVVVTTLGKVSIPEEMVVLGPVKITVVLSEDGAEVSMPVPEEVEEFEAEVPVCVEHAVPVDVVTGFVTDRGSVYGKVWIGSPEEREGSADDVETVAVAKVVVSAAVEEVASTRWTAMATRNFDCIVRSLE
jgi:hypothetical protein